MNLQEHHDEDRHDEQGVQGFVVSGMAHPAHQLLHEARRVKWLGSLEDHADLPAHFIDGHHIVRHPLVVAEIALKVGPALGFFTGSLDLFQRA
ncbi:hypothetical protein D9M68_812570 [compost metagenome]